MTAPSAGPGHLRVHVRLFGALRDLAAAPELSLEVPRGTTAARLRRYVREALAAARRPSARDGLVESAAVAAEEGVLADADAVGEGADEVRVALLPPVCGG